MASRACRPPAVSSLTGNGAAPSTGSTDADGDGLSAAQPATASQSSAAPASASALPAQGNSGSGAAAEGGADEGNPSAEARVVESSAELAAEVPDADDEAAAGSDEADGDEDEWDIELTPEGLRYATTRWDGSRNMTPNRRPTREEREGYIDNEELQEEVRPRGWAGCRPKRGQVAHSVPRAGPPVAAALHRPGGGTQHSHIPLTQLHT